MKTMLVDDEPLAMKRFEIACKEIDEISIVGTFDNALTALNFASKNDIELAVLDIEMPYLNGIELGKKLREINKNIVIIYITGYGEYALAAYHLHAAAYLMKPYDQEEIVYALETAKKLQQKSNKPSIIIHTFGRFDVFINGKPLHFKSTKAKELLAILVDAKGGTINSEKAISLLWEDRPFNDAAQSLYYKVAKSMEHTLEEAGISSILNKSRYTRSINIDMFYCDYYAFLNGEEKAKKSFQHEYMSNYSWGEDTLSYLYHYSN